MSKFRIEIQKVNKQSHKVFVIDNDNNASIDISDLIKGISINIYPIETDISIRLNENLTRYIDNTKYL